VSPADRAILASKLATGALFAALAVGAALLFLTAFAPKAHPPKLAPMEGYDLAAMRAAVAPERVRARTDEIVALGSRFLGQPGFYKAADYVRGAYKAAGLEISEMPVRSAAPRTLCREILSESGAPLAGVEIYPFFPNHFQPMNTPEEGLTGRIVLVSDEVLAKGVRFDDAIALVDTARPPTQFLFNWVKYAQLGFRAVIVASRTGLDAMPWDTLAPASPGDVLMVSSVAVNYVRLAATEGIFAHVGETVRLKVRTEYHDTENAVIIGILRSQTVDEDRLGHVAPPPSAVQSRQQGLLPAQGAPPGAAEPQGSPPGAAEPQEAREALVVTAAYDACSILPDLAPGTLQAVPLAEQLALLDGLKSYAGSLKRDVVFVAHGSRVMAHDGLVRLVGALGSALDREKPYRDIAARLATDREAAARIEAVLAKFDAPEFFVDAPATLAAVDSLDPAARSFFEEQVRYVLNTLICEAGERQLQARLRFLREAKEDLQGPSFNAFMKEKEVYNEAVSVSGYPLEKLLGSRRKFVEDWRVRERTIARLKGLAAYHRGRITELDAAARINRLMAAYRNLVVVSPNLLPADAKATKGEAMSFFMGEGIEYWVPYQYPVMSNLLLAVTQRAKPPEGFAFQPFGDRHEGNMTSAIRSMPLDAKFWNRQSYPAFALVNTDRVDSYAAFSWPVERPYMRDMATIRTSLDMMGRAVLALGFGNGAFKPPIFSQAARHYGGHVFVAGVGTAIVPNYPLAGALVGCKPVVSGAFEKPGYVRFLSWFADPYGHYEMMNSTADVMPDWSPDYSPEAVGYGPSGLITHMKDEGPQGQATYKSMRISSWGTDFDNVNIVTFRAAPVAILDLINPQTMRAYAGVEFITRDGLAEMARHNTYAGVNGLLDQFVEPDRFFYLELKAGSPENELVQTIRAFVLGVDDAWLRDEAAKNGVAPPPPAEQNGRQTPAPPRAAVPHGAADDRREIDGRGYLAADVPILQDVPSRVARSMTYVNGKRLARLRQYHMADARTEEFHEKSEKLLAESAAPNVSKHEASLLAREAVTYATLNHPVLRQSIAEAVIGVVWYLGLLVPFVFFLERLLFGFTDIRRQLLAQAAIFLVIFSLLWTLHPAFSMIRSSLMILLGFVILLISSGITVLFWGKFQENLEQLKMRRGQVTAAEVNTLGVVGTAFMLGLNNMHRRKVRTGLTCLTLVLITFAMICFTSIQTDLVDKATPVGKAPYQGFVVKRERMAPITGVEEYGLQTAYADRFKVASRSMLVGEQTWEREVFNPELTLVYDPAQQAGGASLAAPLAGRVSASPLGAGATARKAMCDSLLMLSWDEPLRGQIRFVTKPCWFEKPASLAAPLAGREDANTRPASGAANEAPASAPAAAPAEPPPIPIMISDATARELNISAQAVDAGAVTVMMNGRAFRVLAIFQGESLDQVRDLDGKPIVPFDVEGMKTVRKTKANEVIAEDEDPRIAGDRIVLAPPANLGFDVPHGFWRMTSVAVEMGGLNYKDARAWIDRHLEQTGQPTYYGLDGVAYYGKRTRESSFAGGLELVIPLIIAGLTVLATMRGSVYERQNEIFVYNALGIAPRFVFAMFFAEAFVYAVVGSVLGYVLSQGTGRVLTDLGWTGGLAMTFTSIRTIYASLLIMGAVFLSTYFPARTAMQISMPAEDAGWKLKDPEGDELAFDLPFTFNQRDRIAILAFFHRFFQDHGEGGGGPFFAGAPECGVREAAEARFVPGIQTVVWLKPFDLGVSQRLAISLPPDPETREFIARIQLTRLSGTHEAWMRLNHRFVGRLRRHFLYWRAVGPDERAEMFDEAKSMLESHFAAPLAGRSTST